MTRLSIQIIKNKGIFIQLIFALSKAAYKTQRDRETSYSCIKSMFIDILVYKYNRCDLRSYNKMVILEEKFYLRCYAFSYHL